MVVCRLCVYSTKNRVVYCSARHSDTWMITSFLQHNKSKSSSKSEAEMFITLGDGYLKGIWRIWGYMFWTVFK